MTKYHQLEALATKTYLVDSQTKMPIGLVLSGDLGQRLLCLSLFLLASRSGALVGYRCSVCCFVL